MSLDPDRREDIVAYTVLAGYDLLEKSAEDAVTCMTEFFNELEGYWLGLPGSRRSRAALEIDGNSRLVSSYANMRLSPPKWYFTERHAVPPREFRVENAATHRALYLHLDDFPMPPAHPDKLGTSFIEGVHARLSPPQLKLWSELLSASRKGEKRLALLTSFPRSAGGLSLVGVVFGASRGVIAPDVEVVPLTVRRHTPIYMRERGGASLELMNKHVAVLGCGAVGSVVADTLAAAGVGKLTLVDYDEYSEDNVFRHILEPMYIDFPKVLALQFELERKYPGLQVTPVHAAAQTWLKGVDVAKLDGIVLAFGAPSIERSFARYFRGTSSMPVVFTWLEALDLGGHSVLTFGNQEGCLDCLYRDDEGHPVLYPRTSFLEPDQHITRNLTGCTSIFVPFGALQARRTGLLAAEHMLQALSGDTKTSYRFWVGEGEFAAKEGLRMTHWWSEAKRTQHAEATLRAFGRPCKRCRGGK